MGTIATKDAERQVSAINWVHTDEWTGDSIDKLFSPYIPGVRFHTRRVPEWAKWRRGMGPGNPVYCFQGRPDGDADERYAWEVTTGSKGSVLRADFHSSRYGRDYAVSSRRGWQSPLVRGLAGLTGRDQVLLNKAHHVAGVLADYCCIELTPGSTMLPRLPDYLARIARGWDPPERDMLTYEYLTCVPYAIAERLGLDRVYDHFATLPDRLAEELSLGVPLVAVGGMWISMASAITAAAGKWPRWYRSAEQLKCSIFGTYARCRKWSICVYRLMSRGGSG